MALWSRAERSLAELPYREVRCDRGERGEALRPEGCSVDRVAVAASRDRAIDARTGDRCAERSRRGERVSLESVVVAGRQRREQRGGLAGTREPNRGARRSRRDGLRRDRRERGREVFEAN